MPCFGDALDSSWPGAVWQGGATPSPAMGYLGRRFALIRTSTESGRPFQKSSRMRPSGSCVTVAGMALAVRYQPAGSTTALRIGSGLPKTGASASPTPTSGGSPGSGRVLPGASTFPNQAFQSERPRPVQKLWNIFRKRGRISENTRRLFQELFQLCLSFFAR